MAMEKRFCSYCGEPLDEECECERDLVKARDQFIEDYNNDPLVQAGWANEDAIYNSRRER